MTYVVKINTKASVALLPFALAAVFATIAAISGKSDEVVSLGENAMQAVRGANPYYSGVANTSICSCNNVMGTEVCACFGAPDGTDCIACDGLQIVSGVYVPTGGTGGVQPAGGNGQCSSLLLWTGDCKNNTCANQIVIGNCTNTWPYFEQQPIGIAMLDGTTRRAGLSSFRVLHADSQ